MTDRKFGVAVGYKRPPVSTQFKKGQSGNPKGRTKASDALSLIIRKSAKERVTVQENGTRKSLTKREATVKQLFNKAMSGDQRAIKLVLDLLNSYDNSAEPPVPKYTMSDADREVLAEMVRRARFQSGDDDNAE
jgi:hypothetical protein